MTSDLAPVSPLTPMVGVNVVLPIGAVVTDEGWTFAVEPVNPAAQPHRVRCGRCLWQATADLAGAVDAIRRHTLAHRHHATAG